MRRPYRSLWIEIGLVLITAALSIFFTDANSKISSDGIGYYDYLPCTFIYHDLDHEEHLNGAADNSHVNKYSAYAEYEGGKVNKYHCGTAVLLAPFFLVAQLVAPDNPSGYEPIFHMAVQIAALTYLLLALILCRKLLLTYHVRPSIIPLVQLMLVAGTNVLYYSAALPAFSHVYSLFAITAFALCVRNYSIQPKRTLIVWLGLLLGLIFILRPVNILVVLFIPFLAGSGSAFRNMLRNLSGEHKFLFIGAICTLIILSIQCIAWYLQTGDWFVYSYQHEYFDFSSPHMLSILFSFRKGLFIYSPVLLLLIIGIIHLVRNGEGFMTLSFLIPFLVLTYVLSSWHDWTYGHSFGLRAFIEYFTIFLIPVAIFIDSSRATRITGYIFALLFVPLHLIQSWQYHHYILHWHDMNFERYAKVFLRTAEPFKGLVWKEEILRHNYMITNVPVSASITTSSNQVDTLLNESFGHLLPNAALDEAVIIVRTSNTFDPENECKIELNVMDSSGTVVRYTRPVYLLHFAEGSFNEMQSGQYPFVLKEYTPVPSDRLLLRIFNADQPTELQHVSVEIGQCRN